MCHSKYMNPGKEIKFVEGSVLFRRILHKNPQKKRTKMIEKDRQKKNGIELLYDLNVFVCVAVAWRNNFL